MTPDDPRGASIVVGVAGGSASGKTTVVSELVRLLENTDPVEGGRVARALGIPGRDADEARRCRGE